jgi:hypothetical protein
VLYGVITVSCSLHELCRMDCSIPKLILVILNLSLAAATSGIKKIISFGWTGFIGEGCESMQIIKEL